MAKKTIKKKQKKNILNGVAHIHSTFNNTIVTIADEKGNVIAWSSAGAVGFKGTKKSTPYAAQLVAQTVARVAMENGMKQIKVESKGSGPGRDAAIRSIQAEGIEILSMQDKTPIPHNGCRPPKRKRG